MTSRNYVTLSKDPRLNNFKNVVRVRAFACGEKANNVYQALFDDGGQEAFWCGRKNLKMNT